MPAETRTVCPAVTRDAAGAIEQYGCVTVPVPLFEQFGSFLATYSVVMTEVVASACLGASANAAPGSSPQTAAGTAMADRRAARRRRPRARGDRFTACARGSAETGRGSNARSRGRP